MDAIELLSTRASNKRLVDPAPDDVTLQAILSDALRAPDHGFLRPWKILVVRGAGREALGDVFAASLGPDAGEEQRERARRKPLRAPLVIVVAAVPVPSPKAPEIEQILSAGAVAHGVLLGLAARGFAGMWRTGEPTYDAGVKRALGLRPEDHIVAFLYAGTPSAPPPDVRRPDPRDFVSTWPSE